MQQEQERYVPGAVVTVLCSSTYDRKGRRLELFGQGPLFLLALGHVEIGIVFFVFGVVFLGWGSFGAGFVRRLGRRNFLGQGLIRRSWFGRQQLLHGIEFGSSSLTIGCASSWRRLPKGVDLVEGRQGRKVKVSAVQANVGFEGVKAEIHGTSAGPVVSHCNRR